jgi:hypothetical protein
VERKGGKETAERLQTKSILDSVAATHTMSYCEKNMDTMRRDKAAVDLYSIKPTQELDKISGAQMPAGAETSEGSSRVGCSTYQCQNVPATEQHNNGVHFSKTDGETDTIQTEAQEYNKLPNTIIPNKEMPEINTPVNNLSDAVQTDSQTSTASSQAISVSNEMLDDCDNPRPDLQMGDHIYTWEYHLSLVPMQQHHAIVMDVVQLPLPVENESESETDRDESVPVNNTELTYQDGESTPINGTPQQSPITSPCTNTINSSSSPIVPSSSRTSRDTFTTKTQNLPPHVWHLIIAEWQSQVGRFAIRAIPYFPYKQASSRKSRASAYTPVTWHKVQYKVSSWHKHTRMSGTCTTASSSPPGLVRARAEFAVDYTLQQVLSADEPSLTVMDDNDTDWESVQSPAAATGASSTDNSLKEASWLSHMTTSESWAVWCTTGTYATLQMTSWLWTLSAGQVKSTATLAGMAATTTVTVPAAGLWGWMGYTTQVAWLATQPVWLPWALAGYGVVTIGLPYWALKRHGKWAKQRTERLNRAFGEYAVVNSEQFVEKMMEWSEQEYK